MDNSLLRCSTDYFRLRIIGWTTPATLHLNAVCVETLRLSSAINGHSVITQSSQSDVGCTPILAARREAAISASGPYSYRVHAKHLSDLSCDSREGVGLIALEWHKTKKTSGYKTSGCMVRSFRVRRVSLKPQRPWLAQRGQPRGNRTE